MIRSQRFTGRWLAALAVVVVGTDGLGQGFAQPPPLCPPLFPLISPEPPLLEPIPHLLAAPETMAPQLEDPPTPMVGIRVRVPASAEAGKELEYRIEVENRSRAAAHHVIVRDPLPATARYVRATPEPSARDPELLWRLGTLEAGARREIVLVVTPAGQEEIQNCARVQFEHGECVTTKIARPELRLRKEGPARALLYDALTYQLTLTNTGTAPLTNLLLTDQLPKGLEHESGKDRLSWILGTLAPGQSRTVSYQVIAKAVGRLCNKAAATADGGYRQEVESCVTVTEAKLELGMTGPKKRYLNTPAIYDITVQNPGTAPLENVQLTNTVPPGTTFIRASEGGQLADNQVRWSLGALTPGASLTLTLELQAQSTGRICNKATVAADRGLTKQAEACTDFTGVPALALEVEDTEDPVEVGSNTTYNVTVRNPGTTPAANVKIVATVPAQMELLRATGTANNRTEGQRIIYDPLTLAAGDTARYSIEVRARRAGDVRFRVELTAEPLTAGPVQQEESTTIYEVLPSSRLKKPKAVQHR
jgi:uncharacterized repeat protein (TIGR01451 family)